MYVMDGHNAPSLNGWRWTCEDEPAQFAGFPPSSVFQIMDLLFTCLYEEFWPLKSLYTCSWRTITAGENSHSWIPQLWIQHAVYLFSFLSMLTIAYLAVETTTWQEKSWQNLVLRKKWFKVQNEHIANKPLQGIKKDYPCSLGMNNGWQNNLPSISEEKGRAAASYRCTMAGKSSYSGSLCFSLTSLTDFFLLWFCQNDKPRLRQQQSKGHRLD